MLKHSFLFVFLFFVSIQCFSQQHIRAVSVDSEQDNEHNIVFSASNADYCDYYVILEFPEIMGYTVRGSNPSEKTVNRGSSNMVSMRRDTHFTTSPSYSWRYQSYRGNINPKLNLDYVYSLPVKSGDSIRVSFAKNRDFELIFDLRHVGDTIYACRSGKICDDELTDGTSRFGTRRERIIVFHDDKSFSEYSGYTKRLKYAGQNVNIGEPIAIVEADNNGKKRFSFSVCYLDKNKVKEEVGNKHSALIPVFYSTNRGDCKLEEKTTYVAEINEHMITQEMSKKEREKYEKKKK